MIRINPVSIALSSWIGFSAAFAPLLPSAARAADCAQWDISGHWEIGQSNGITVTMDLVQTGKEVQGMAYYETKDERGFKKKGSVTGSIDGSYIRLTTSWLGEYKGGVGSDAFIGGSTGAPTSPEIATWRSDRAATCQAVAEPSATPPAGQAEEPKKPVKQLGKRRILATVLRTVEVYDAPGGNGNNLGDLTAPNTVELAAGSCKDSWCNVQGPAVPTGIGWVYDGQDYDSLEWLPAR